MISHMDFNAGVQRSHIHTDGRIILYMYVYDKDSGT